MWNSLWVSQRLECIPLSWIKDTYFIRFRLYQLLGVGVYQLLGVGVGGILCQKCEDQLAQACKVSQKWCKDSFKAATY